MPDMATGTHLRALITHKVGGDLTAYVNDRRCMQHSWRKVAANIRRDTGIVVSHETLRAWFATSDAA